MTRSEFLFTAIDVLFHPAQNYRRYKGIVKEKEFAYDESRPDECNGEIYYDPALLGEKKLPVVLNIHGGGFVKGDKKHRKSLCKRFAHHGYFTVNINYGLSPRRAFPVPLADCVNALNYLTVLAEKYNIDLDKVCVTGDSAGAYCATQLVSLANSEEQRAALNIPEFKVKPALLVSFCGPYDLIASIELTKLPFNLVWDIGRCYLGADFGLKKDFSNIKDYPYIKEICPSNFVNSNWCPSFLVMSKKDIFCKGQGEILAKLLIDAGVETETYSSTKFIDNHCFHMNMWTKPSKECFEKVFAFMDKHLKG